jgi:RNA polymerase-binding transcription factor DksA
MQSTVLTPTDLDGLRSLLEERYVAAVHRAACLFDEAMGQLQAAGSSSVDDMVQAQRTTQAAKEAALEARLADEALVRLATGSYGSCDECRRAIPLDRLRTTPEARWCGGCGTAETSVPGSAG